MIKIEIQQADITKIEADAIVNAANTSLLGGSGVDGAIHRAGGKTILEECQRIRAKQGGCAVCEAVITNAGQLKAHKVIHTVGPRWAGGIYNESDKLASCYSNVLALAEKYDLSTIAIPNISTGVYKYPKMAAAQIALQTVQNYRSTSIQKVIFVCFDKENYAIYQSLLAARA